MRDDKRRLLVFSSLSIPPVVVLGVIAIVVFVREPALFVLHRTAIDVAAAVLLLALAMLLVYRRGGEPVVRLYALVSSIFALLSMLDILQVQWLSGGRTEAVSTLFIVWAVVFACSIGIVIPAMLLLVLLFPIRSPLVARRWVIPGLFALPWILLLVNVSFHKLSPRIEGFGFVALIALILCYVIALPVALVKQFRRSTAEQKRQIAWPILGIVAALFAGLVVPSFLNSSMVLSSEPGKSDIRIAFVAIPAAFALIPLTFLLGITKYRLFDIDIIIKKTVTYTIVSGLVVALYLGTSMTAARLFTAGSSDTVKLLSTAIAAATFIPIRDRVQKKIDQRFFRRRTEDLDALGRLDAAIAAASDMPSLLSESAKRLREIFVCRSASVFVKEPGSGVLVLSAATGLPDSVIGLELPDDSSKTLSLRNLDSEDNAGSDGVLRAIRAKLLVPVRRHGSLVALFALGARISDEKFDARDERIAGLLADHLALGLENCRLRQFSAAESDWRLLDRISRIVFVAIARAQEPVTRDRIVDEVTTAMNAAGMHLSVERIFAAIERLIDHGAVVDSADHRLSVGRSAWLSLPDVARSLDAVIHDVGQRVGAYELLERIGRGGMGEVFRGMNVHDGSFAAVKLLPRLDDRPELRKRFEREGAMIAALSHPNIVRFLERGEHDGRLYLAMELLEGDTLADAFCSREWGVARAMDVAQQVASALAALHGIGVVHRDVKPSNVMLTKSGRAVLLDFGLARADGASALTEGQKIIGSLPYIAPELLKGEDADCRADVWSFGIVLFEMLARHRPWRSIETAPLVAEITKGNVDLRSLVIVEGLAPVTAIVAECLEVQRDLRISDGRELTRRLTHAVRLLGHEALPARQMPREEESAISAMTGLPPSARRPIAH